MFGNNTQSLVHLSGKSASADQPQLPRGECGFLLSEAESGSGSRQRCSCRSFYPDGPVIRSRCGCGHQAWHHESQPLGAVSTQEYIEAVDEIKKLRQEIKRIGNLEQELKQELFKERLAREEHFKIYKGIEQRLYDNMRWLKVHMDDKVEAVIDKTTEFNNQIKSVQERLTLVDEVTMELENRIDSVEPHGSMSSREATPVVTPPNLPPVPQIPAHFQQQQQQQQNHQQQPQHHHSFGQLPIRTDKKYPLSWNVRVFFVPRKAQKFAFDPDSNGYKRCATRNLQQNLEFPSQDSSCFANTIETSFKGIMRGRAWMPMYAHRPADEPFGRMRLDLLPKELTVRDVWDYPFLEDHCIAHDKMLGDVLYITLQFEDVTWNEIKFLPAVLGADETCWQHDEELDGSAKYKSLDSELMYEYQDPPPYSSRTHSLMDRGPSRLDVLADSASMLSRAGTRSDTASILSRTAARSDTASVLSRTDRMQTNFSEERTSLRSFETEETDDEHRDKKPKLRTKQSLPNITSPNSSMQAMYVSGRSKRKMPVREKGTKEPLHWNVGNVAGNVVRWRPNLLHPHSSKGKEAADSH